MGGKKKIKWRKLPLAEFTKECVTTPVGSKQDCKTNSSKEDEPSVSMCSEELAVNTVPCSNEYGEYTDGMFYPTSYVVYNPMEMPVYPNYMLPPDACCYYYMPPELAPVQEYAPVVPYQEYIPPVKDPVYLLFPAPGGRPAQGASGYRRYRGYAEYAVIPKKNYSCRREEKDRSRKSAVNTNFARNDNQSNHVKKMTAFNPKDPAHVQNEEKFIVSREQSAETKNMSVFEVERNESVKEIQKPKRNQEFVQVHTSRASERKNSSDLNIRNSPKNFELGSHYTPINTKESVNSQAISYVQNVEETDKVQNCQNLSNQLLTTTKGPENNVSNTINTTLNTEDSVLKMNTQPENCNCSSPEKTEGNDSVECQDIDAQSTTVVDNLHNHQIIEEAQNLMEDEFPSPLPDILSTVHKTTPVKTTNNEISNIQDPKGISTNLDQESAANLKFSKTKVLLSPYTCPPLFSDTESELKRLTSLESLRANQSLYKLAYDESSTDQSADSRSPSPVDPESQVPRSITNDEIIIHEAESGSEAGSEDVELIPHRYESESFLNENKHLYVNRLSLAVELLRTQESLPYDAQFKRVSDDETGEVNLGFVEDSSSCKSSEGAVTSQSQAIRGSIERSSFPIEEGSCEEAKEAAIETANNRDNTEQVRGGYRRFQVQFRHYFSPRAVLGNPCLCCVIM